MIKDKKKTAEDIIEKFNVINDLFSANEISTVM